MILTTLLAACQLFTLNDGYFDIDQKIFACIDEESLRTALEKSETATVSDLVVHTKVHGFLVKTDDQLILIDAGCGKECGGSTGFLLTSLGKTGYTPEEITMILITHLHPDHIGGLVSEEGMPVFPKALVYVSAIDAAYWRDPAEEDAAPEKNRPCFPIARAMLAPYEATGRLRLVRPGDTLTPGLVVIDAAGHTPGHTAYLWDNRVLFWGDLVHSAGIQFAHPEWYVTYDSDGPAAIQSRKRLLALSADENLLVGGAHMPGSGFGHVKRHGDVFSWQPNY